MRLYTKKEREYDDRLIAKLEKNYKNEKDSVKKAEKEVYFHYMYEARRMKLRAKQFQWMIKRDSKALLEEQQDNLNMDAIFGRVLCDYRIEEHWVLAVEEKTGYTARREWVKEVKNKINKTNKIKKK